MTSDGGLQLGINAAVTALALAVTLAVLGPIGGGHLHPLVSIVDAVRGHRRWGRALAHVPAQVAEGIAGVPRQVPRPGILNRAPGRHPEA